MGYKKFYPVDKNDPRVWANQIKILMEARGITQQRLASESGVPATTISEWIGKNKKSETGLREPGVTRFYKVAKLFRLFILFALFHLPHICIIKKLFLIT